MRLRLRLKTLLVLVAIAGALCWAAIRLVPWSRQMWAKSAEYREMADFVRGNQRLDLKFAGQLEAQAIALEREARPGDAASLERAGRARREAAYYRREMVGYHAGLERCYRRGAARPWEALPPFPEIPKKP